MKIKENFVKLFFCCMGIGYLLPTEALSIINGITSDSKVEIKLYRDCNDSFLEGYIEAILDYKEKMTTGINDNTLEQTVCLDFRSGSSAMVKIPIQEVDGCVFQITDLKENTARATPECAYTNKCDDKTVYNSGNQNCLPNIGKTKGGIVVNFISASKQDYRIKLYEVSEVNKCVPEELKEIIFEELFNHAQTFPIDVGMFTKEGSFCLEVIGTGVSGLYGPFSKTTTYHYKIQDTKIVYMCSGEGATEECIKQEYYKP